MVPRLREKLISSYAPAIGAYYSNKKKSGKCIIKWYRVSKIADNRMKAVKEYRQRYRQKS